MHILVFMRVLLMHILCGFGIASVAIGDLRFHNLNQYPTGLRSTGIFASDFDGDGDVDLAVANRLSNSVTVLFNNGLGQFQDSIQVNTGEHPRYVDGADFDGDGDVDLCTPDIYSMTISILENDGSGSYTIQDQYNLFTPAFLWVDDLDQDGIEDIVVLHWDEDAKQPGNSNGKFTPMFGNGDGTFDIGSSAWVGVQPRAGASADLNGDGLIDAVVADIKSQTISIVLGTGPRTWSDSVQIPMSPGAPRYIVLGDFDNDGDVDMAALDKLGGNFWMFHNDGNANFTLEETISVNGSPHSMALVDIDDDSDADFVVCHVDSETQLILFNDGTGHIEAMQSLVIPGGTAEVKCIDVSNDGLLDIVTANVNVSHPGASVLIQLECLVCEDKMMGGVFDCPPNSFDFDVYVDSFTMIDIQLQGESFSGNSLDYVITSLPENGIFYELSGLVVTSVPYYLSGDTVRYFPESGTVSVESFQYLVNDCLPSNQSEVHIHIDSPFPDECNTAFEVVNGYSDISTLNATDSPDYYDASQCDTTNLGALHNDIWLRYVACGDGELLIDTCGLVDFDSDLVIYQGDCCSLEQISCNGDATGCKGNSSVTLAGIETGMQYFIRLGGSNDTAMGSGTIYFDGPLGDCVVTCFCDIQVDGAVNVSDLLIILEQWGYTCGVADLNVDGIVDITDFLLVIGSWGPCEQ